MSETTRRIGDPPEPRVWPLTASPLKQCSDIEHTHDRRVKRSPGRYEHTCPSCGKSYRFTVERTFHYG